MPMLPATPPRMGIPTLVPPGILAGAPPSPLGAVAPLPGGVGTPTAPAPTVPLPVAIPTTVAPPVALGSPAPAPPLAPALPPVPAPPKPPVPGPDAVLATRPKPETITNPFERQAAMIVETAQDWAKKLAANLGEHPADYQPVDNSTVHEMFQQSPFGADAPAEFWRQHDQLLQQAQAANDPDPYAVAEQGALQAVYPSRFRMALIGQLAPEQAVARAEQLLKISHGEIAKGSTPDSLPSVALPEPTKETASWL